MIEPSWTDFHVSYRVGARHPLDRGAAGRAILAGREPGGPGYVATTGELQPGARGIAASVLGVDGLEASVGIVILDDIDVDRLGPQVVAAAHELASLLR